MALRAVGRELRRSALRLDRAVAASRPDEDLLRRSLHLKAYLLPEPFSPEAAAYFSEQGSQRPGQPDNWERLLHWGTRRALRAKFDRSELLNDALSVLGALGALEHDLVSAANFVESTKRAVEPTNGASALDGEFVGSHAALAAVVDGVERARVERELESKLAEAAAKAMRAAEEAGSISRPASSLPDYLPTAVSDVLFGEFGLRALPPGVAPGRTVEECLAHTRAAMVHRAFETQQGSGLALGLIMTDVLARCAPPQLPPPRLLAVPRSSRPLATYTRADGVRPTSEVHGTVHAALAAARDLAKEEADASEGSWWDRRFLVAWADTTRGSAVLLDPSAAGVRTQLACSPELLDELRRTDGAWEAWLGSADRERLRRSTISRAQRTRSHAPSPWEVPAAALLDDRGVMEVLLRQLTELYDAAGTPDALRMSHRCAALLTALRNGEEERPIDELVDLA